MLKFDIVYCSASFLCCMLLFLWSFYLYSRPIFFFQSIDEEIFISYKQKNARTKMVQNGTNYRDILQRLKLAE